ncbi:MAG: hypothetical protein ACLPUO_26340 [Streptosporangiaceae bacterium]
MPPESPSQPPHAPAQLSSAGGPPQSSIAALLRTREYLRPYYGQLIFMLIAAIVAASTEIVIPLLTKAAIDGPISHHDRGCCSPLASQRSPSGSLR